MYGLPRLTHIDDETARTVQAVGVSMLVETMNGSAEGTESTVLGPFHMTESPRRELGDSIDFLGTGRPCVVSGRVLTADGTPLPDTELDVWQCSEDGFYDVQQPDVQPPGNGRGLFRTDGGGRTVVPSHYPIPTDGPVGRLLEATGRHPYRPAHIHFIASADHHRPVTTHAFVADSPYVDADAVFAVKRGLIADFTESFDVPAAPETVGARARLGAAGSGRRRIRRVRDLAVGQLPAPTRRGGGTQNASA
ncbi:hypothetical protein ACFYWX_26170 [Streptomyces sp. NPDC002888]|uniref:dioxygenase family protein n=1 Tax=Streptomyces sp. NPDC002888 TaxID=3364668 RepID=UPI0036873859